ncbi:MAG: hypothetical protein SV186_03975 [Candidatus Nanohaloarchaea archaeon]|nr:hypothetical protein [Candidatus Nanohaloarchaea archaeon]
MFHELREEYHAIERKRVLAAMLVWPVVAAVLALTVGRSMLGVTAFFFLPPALYFIYTLDNGWHLLVFTVVMTLVFFPLDYLAHATGLWNVKTAFPRVLSGAAFESFLWGLFIVPYVVGFHESFFDDQQFDYFTWEFDVFEGLAVIGLLAVIIGVGLPGTLTLPLVYLLLISPLVVLPLIYGVMHGVRRLELTTLYFFYVNLLHELTALQIGAWTFPLEQTSSILSLHILGHTIPIEEFVVYMLLLAPSIVCYHHILAKER